MLHEQEQAGHRGNRGRLIRCTRHCIAAALSKAPDELGGQQLTRWPVAYTGGSERTAAWHTVALGRHLPNDQPRHT